MALHLQIFLQLLNDWFEAIMVQGLSHDKSLLLQMRAISETFFYLDFFPSHEFTSELGHSLCPVILW